jgi:hypothetical protein
MEPETLALETLDEAGIVAFAVVGVGPWARKGDVASAYRVTNA